MSEPLPGRSDFVLPSLMDRLVSPVTTGVGGAEFLSAPGGAGGVGDRAYRDSVQRDLEWLFNSHAVLAGASPELRRRCPNAMSSVLNYGLRGIFGSVVHDVAAMEQRVADALSFFEPRILIERQSLRLSKEGQLVEILIDGILLTRRASRHLVVKTDLDTDLSEVVMEASG